MAARAVGRRKPSISIYRAVWSVAAVVLGSAGAYVSAMQQSSWLLGFGFAIILLSAVGIGVRYPSWSWTRVPVEITRTIVAVTAGWSIIGLVAILGGIGGLAGLMVVLTAPEVLAVIAQTARRTLARVTAGAAPKVVELPDLGQLPLVDLCGRWCASHAELRRLQHTRQVALLAALIAARASYLDELERRDPVGFDRWLTSAAGSDGDPRDYIAAPTST